MSQTLQPPPTASMTISGGQAGIMPISFGYYPVEGSRAVMAQYSWLAQSGYAEDLSQLPAKGVQTAIQSAFIDNSTNAQPVTLTIGGTDQVVVVPPNSQGVFPLFFTGTPNFQISVPAIGAGLTRVYLLNVPPQAAGVWANMQTLQGAGPGIPAFTPGSISGAAGAGGFPISGTYRAAPGELSDGNTNGLALDAYNSLLVDTENNTPTYSAAAYFQTTASPTDCWSIYGSATKTVRIHQIIITTAGSPQPQLVRRSALNTGGTYNNIPIAQHDTNSPAPTAGVGYYSVNPTALGASAGLVESFFYQNSNQVFNYGTTDQAIVLRGINQALTIYLAAVAQTQITLNVKVKWTEV